MDVRITAVNRDSLDEYTEQAIQILTVAVPALAEALKLNKGRGFDFIIHAPADPHTGDFEYPRRIRYQTPRN